jgi:hypothetical protein
MENQLAVYETAPLSAQQIQEQVNLIQEVMKSIMKEGEHYGKIPGCGDKPSLLKPGAEKLMFTFRLVADPEVEVFDLYHPTVQGHREYRAKVKISSINGIYMGGGIGSCSTMESKYRFRGGEKINKERPVPKEYWNLKKEGKNAEAQALIGGAGFSTGKFDGAWMICEIGEKQEHDNPADFYNTAAKMAKKRALVDAALTVTAASDIFTQDIEELVDNGVMKPKQEAKKEPVKPPQRKAETCETKDPDEPATEPQVKAIQSLFGKLGVKDDFEKHSKASRMAGIPEPEVITSLKLLTKSQASKVIEVLMAEGTQQ